MTPHDYLSMEQTAEVLQRSVEQVMEWVSYGRLLAIRLPGNGDVIPMVCMPPYHRPHEED